MGIDKNMLLLIQGAEIGQGDASLGAKLTDLFFKVLSESETRPGRIIFLNSAVFLTTEGTPLLETLKAIEKQGTELVSCITCLTYFDRMDKVVVGRPGDMKNTVNSLLNSKMALTI